jgi:hypothetical protein
MVREHHRVVERAERQFLQLTQQPGRCGIRIADAGED